MNNIYYSSHIKYFYEIYPIGQQHFFNKLKSTYNQHKMIIKYFENIKQMKYALKGNLIQAETFKRK